MRVTVRASDYDWFEVEFAGREPIQVTHHQIEWRVGFPMQLSARLAKIIHLARKELKDDERGE